MINKNKKKICYSIVIADYHICAALMDDICEKWHSKNICTLNERKK